MTLTNLAIVTITMLTNVSEVDNRPCKYFPDYAGLSPFDRRNCYTHQWNTNECAASATEKRVEETVVKRVEVYIPHEDPTLLETVENESGLLTFRAPRYYLTQDFEVSRTVRVYRRSNHWTLQLVEPPTYPLLTNGNPKIIWESPKP